MLPGQALPKPLPSLTHISPMPPARLTHTSPMPHPHLTHASQRPHPLLLFVRLTAYLYVRILWWDSIFGPPFLHELAMQSVCVLIHRHGSGQSIA